MTAPPSPAPAAPPRPARAGRRLRILMVLLCLGALVPVADAHAESGRWQWPVPAPHPVLRAFEAPASPYGPGHRGLDITAAAGAPVRAVEDGTVHFAGQVAGRGVVSVRHQDGLLSTYEPVTGSVEPGQVVAAGDALGTIAAVDPAVGHCRGAPCLHLGARRGQDYLDPLPLLGGRGPSVLLPWAGRDGAAAPGPAEPAAVGSGTPRPRSGPVMGVREAPPQVGIRIARRD